MSDDQQNRPADDGFTPTPDGTETPAPAPDPWARTQFSQPVSSPAPSEQGDSPFPPAYPSQADPAQSGPSQSGPSQSGPGTGQDPFAPPAADPSYGTPPAYGAPPVQGAPGGYGAPGAYQSPAPQGGPGGFQPPVYGAPGGFDPAGYPPPAGYQPSSGYQQAGVPPAKPGTVIASMVMQMIGGALTILMGVFLIIAGVMWETSEDLRNSSFVQEALDDANLTLEDLSVMTTTLIVTGVIFLAIGVFLVYLGFASGQGKNWARITATVLWVIGGLFLITAYLPIIWAAIIIVLLWVPASNAFYSRQPR